MNDLIDRAYFAVQDKLGRFLSSGSRVMGLRDQAAAYAKSDNANVVGKANALTAKGNSLLIALKSIQARAQASLAKANEFQNKLASDPATKGLLDGNPSVMGWLTALKSSELRSQIQNTAADLWAINKEMDAHLDAVEQYAGEVSDLGAYAQGKGVSARLDNATSFMGGAAKFAGDYLAFAKYAAIGVGLFFVWDMAKPFLIAKRASK